MLYGHRVMITDSIVIIYIVFLFPVSIDLSFPMAK